MIDLTDTSKNNIRKIREYGKAKGFLTAKLLGLPSFSHCFIVQNQNDLEQLLHTYPNQQNFCMRSDTIIGDARIEVSGMNGNRQNIFDFWKRISQNSIAKNSRGVALIYWNDSFCPTNEINGAYYLDFIPGEKLVIEYLGKGWDGSYLSHGQASHEGYIIPWEEVLGFKPTKRRTYPHWKVDAQQYDEYREQRVKDLTKGLTQAGIDSSIAELSVPKEYGGIKNGIFEEINDKVIYRLYLAAEKELKKYGEYVAIVQVEKNEIVVPEVIIPDRLMTKTRNVRR